MKLNLPPRPSHAIPSNSAPGVASAPPPAPAAGFYRNADEAAQRKQAILARMEHRRMLAKAALHAGRLARQSSHL